MKSDTQRSVQAGRGAFPDSPKEKTPKLKLPRLRVRGLRVPRAMLWLLGRLHRRMGVGGTDPENGRICSAYVTRQLCRFGRACTEYRERLRLGLQPLWAQADRLLPLVRAPLDPPPRADAPGSGDIADRARLRAQERAARERGKQAAARQAHLEALSDLYNQICGGLEASRDRMETVRELLQSALAAYGQGLLSCPLTPAHLPEAPLEAHNALVLEDRRDTWMEICSILHKTPHISEANEKEAKLWVS